MRRPHGGCLAGWGVLRMASWWRADDRHSARGYGQSPTCARTSAPPRTRRPGQFGQRRLHRRRKPGAEGKAAPLHPVDDHPRRQSPQRPRQLRPPRRWRRHGSSRVRAAHRGSRVGPFRPDAATDPARPRPPHRVDDHGGRAALPGPTRPRGSPGCSRATRSRPTPPATGSPGSPAGRRRRRHAGRLPGRGRRRRAPRGSVPVDVSVRKCVAHEMHGSWLRIACSQRSRSSSSTDRGDAAPPPSDPPRSASWF